MTPAALIRLVRLPAVLTVPGDVLVGAAWSGERRPPAAVAGTALGSSLLYLGGMALNDWADRARDARERPRRPIPSGEVSPAAALALASALTGGALALAAAAGGGRGLRAGAPLAAAVWAYDLRAKDTPAGPWTMALARALDVLMGAPPAPERPWPGAGPPAAVAGAHALLLTSLSAHEVAGADPRAVRRALLGLAAVAAVAAALILAGAPRPREAMFALACLALYGCALGSAGRAALRTPDPARVQRLVGAGVLANMPLQAALLAARGRSAGAVALLAGWPLAQRASQRRSVT